MPSLNSLKLLDYSDKELIAIVEDLREDDGWAWTSKIAQATGLKADKPNQNVGSRLAWLSRGGIVESHENGRRWRVTPIGEVFLNGRLTPVVEKQLANMEPGELYSVLRILGQRKRSAQGSVGFMLGREWRHSSGIG